MFSQLASRKGRLDPLLFALAFGWAHEMCGHAGWVFSFGCRGLIWHWAASARQQAKRWMGEKAAGAKTDPGRIDILLVPQFSSGHYASPCFTLARALLDRDHDAAVAMLKPCDTGLERFVQLARAAGCSASVVELDPQVPLLPIGAFFNAARRFTTLFFTAEPKAFPEFFRARPVWSRFLQILSNEIILGQVKAQLKRWGVGKIVTMNEQWFPSNLLVAAANELGVETHQILHGGMATEFYVPFQCQYLWPEYEVTARQLVGYGINASRLKTVPGLQVASQLGSRGAASHTGARASGCKRQILVLAQYHGYSRFGQRCFRDALNTIFRAAAQRQAAWSLVIRPHPADSADDLASIRKMLDETGVDGGFTDASGDLAEQAVNASLVATATSSAIFVAIAVGTPACVIWGPEQAEAYGNPSLTPDWVVTGVGDLVSILDRIGAEEPAAIPGFAAEQSKSLGLNDWAESPKRVCEELLRSA